MTQEIVIVYILLVVELFLILLSTFLIVLSTFLIVLSLILIYLSKKEEKSRGNHIKAMITETEKLTRREYFQNIYDVLNNSEEYFYSFVTFKKYGGEDDSNVDELIKIIKSRSEETKLKYLAPKERNILKMGYLNTSIGAEVRFHVGLLANDLRFSISDNIYSIIGIPSLERNSGTFKSIKIKSGELTKILKVQFDTFWEVGISYQDYLQETVEEIKDSNPNINDIEIAEYLDVPIEEIRKKMSNHAENEDNLDH